MKTPSKTHLAVFDIDGTLTDSVAAFQASYLAALTPFEFATIDTNWGEYEHHTDSFIFQKIYETNHGQVPDETMRKKFSDELLKIYRANIKDRPVTEITGAACFVEFLDKETPWAVTFATGSLRQPACIKLDACNIRYDEKTLATSTNFLTREDIVDAAIKGAKKHYACAGFQSIVSFGDGLWDYKTAQNMKLDFIGIGEGPKAEQLTQLGNMVFRDFQNPESIMQRMQNP